MTTSDVDSNDSGPGGSAPGVTSPRDSSGDGGLDGYDVVVDERGQRCPRPVISLSRTLRAQSGGAVVALISDDPASAVDLPAWCRLSGATLLSSTDLGTSGATVYVVRKRNDDQPAD